MVAGICTLGNHTSGARIYALLLSAPLAERTAEYNTREGNTSFAGLLAVQTSWHQPSPVVLFKQHPGSGMRSATDIDKKVGENLSKFRLFRGMTQETLADAVGVTFQQLQKYEKGKNRISVSRLWVLAHELGIPVAELRHAARAEEKSTAGLHAVLTHPAGERSMMIASLNPPLLTENSAPNLRALPATGNILFPPALVL